MEIVLARRRDPVFDSPRVQLHGTMRGLRKLVRPALAGLLAALLLLTTTASASHLLHRALHGNDSSPDHNCLACLFAKGQVSAADGLTVRAFFVAAFLFRLAWTSVRALASTDLRFCPSRAPPSLPTVR